MGLESVMCIKKMVGKFGLCQRQSEALKFEQVSDSLISLLQDLSRWWSGEQAEGSRAAARSTWQSPSERDKRP